MFTLVYSRTMKFTARQAGMVLSQGLSTTRLSSSRLGMNASHSRWLTLSSVLNTSTPQPQTFSNTTDQHHTPPDSGTEVDYASAKPFDAIPSPKRIPLIGISRDFTKFSPSKISFFVHERVEQLGKLYREKIVPGAPEFLFVLDPDDVAKVFRADGRHPRRFPLTEWTDIRKELNVPNGLFLA